MEDTLMTIGTGAPPQDLEPGTYRVIVTNVTIEKHSFPDFNTGIPEEKDYFKWEFVVPTDDGEGVPVDGLTTAFTGPKSNTYAHLVALLGASNVVPGMKLRRSDLIGKTALAKLELNKNGWLVVRQLMAEPAGMPPVKTPEPAPAPAPAPEPVANVSPLRKPVRAQATETDLDDLPF